jgi:hypothetical protein
MKKRTQRDCTFSIKSSVISQVKKEELTYTPAKKIKRLEQDIQELNIKIGRN